MYKQQYRIRCLLAAQTTLTTFSLIQDTIKVPKLLDRLKDTL